MTPSPRLVGLSSHLSLPEGHACLQGVEHLSPWLDEAAFMPAARGLLLAQAAARICGTLPAAGRVGEDGSGGCEALHGAVAALGEGLGGQGGLGHPILCSGRRAVLDMFSRSGRDGAVDERDGAAETGGAWRDPLLFLAC